MMANDKRMRGASPQRPKATFDILMDKYKEGRVGIRGRENQPIRNAKPDSSVSLSQASTSVVGSSSNKQSRIPPQ
jgi:hypothetical protein